MLIKTPCSNVCTIDPACGLCRGCGRTLDEIARWSALTDGERARIMAALPRRMAAAFTARTADAAPAATGRPA